MSIYNKEYLVLCVCQIIQIVSYPREKVRQDYINVNLHLGI